MLISVLADRHGLGIVVGGLASTLGGAVMGISRRQIHERSQQATLVAVTEARAEAERARDAVQALREDVLPLEDQLVRLADERHAAVEIDGLPRRLSADVSLALYRVAQEALTNVVKHAPGADAAIELGFADDRVELTVSNGPVLRPHPAPLACSGGGYGLQGLRERVLLLGGRVEAGPLTGDQPGADPFAGGWRVHAVVPA